MNKYYIEIGDYPTICALESLTKITLNFISILYNCIFSLQICASEQNVVESSLLMNNLLTLPTY